MQEVKREQALSVITAERLTPKPLVKYKKKVKYKGKMLKLINALSSCRPISNAKALETLPV